MRTCVCLFLSSLLLALAGCAEEGENVLGIDATGEVRGSAFLDRDDDLQFTGADARFPSLRVSLTPVSGAPVASTTTDALGEFRFSNVRVGSYRITVDDQSLGDTIRVVRIDSAQLTVAAQDTLRPVITLGFAGATILEVKTRPVGTRVSIVASALNAWVTFGDSTVHLADSTGAIRAVQVQPLAINAGDRLRVLATVSRRNNEITLQQLSIVTSRAAELPAPDTTTTAGAAVPGSRLEAGQVRVGAATVLDAVSLPNNDVLLTVNDGSGPLEVLIDGNAGIITSLPIDQGANVDLVGVLVPSSSGAAPWRLKPRRSADVTVRYPPISVRAARSRPTGRFLSVHAIALNASNAFGDNTVHVADTSAAIRVLNRPALFATGDSLTVLGRLEIREGGQPMIIDAIISVFGRGAPPAPRSTTTLLAASADSGRMDAALVRVANATVQSTAVLGDGSIQLRMDDGSGELEVILDSEWARPPYTPPAAGAMLDLVGVLVPVTTGRWLLKPRDGSDIVVK